MNLQQLEYIIAVNKHRHFVAASAQCGVTQPTLSMMIQKLEQELDVVIFDRKKHPIEPTKMGERIIHQAEITLKEMQRIHSMVADETQTLSGELHIGVIPTLASYLIPKFIKTFRKDFPDIQLNLSEMQTENCINSLKKDKLDMFIAATPLEQDSFYEVPLYYERFVAYFAKQSEYKDRPLSASNLPKDNLWVLEEGHCLRSQIFNFCSTNLPYNKVFESGSIDTLTRIVDANGGYTVIPELHKEFLTSAQLKNIREINDPPAIREVSIIIKNTFIKEKMINAVADTIKKLIPEHMLNESLKKYSIKL